MTTAAATTIAICTAFTVTPKKSNVMKRIDIVMEGDALLAEDDAEGVLHQHQEPDRSDHRHVGPIAQQRLVKQPVDRHAEQRRDHDGGEEAERETAGRIGDHHRHIGAERKNRRMRYVQDAQQPINQRQPHRHHGVHAPEGDAGYSEVDVIHPIIPQTGRAEDVDRPPPAEG